MNFINNLYPINYSEEKSKFFASGENYSPQFIYAAPIDQKKWLEYGPPKAKLAAEIKKELSQLKLPEINSSATPNLLSSEEAKERLLVLFQQLQVPPLNIEFNREQAARTSFNFQKKSISFRLPLKLTDVDLEKICRHEIQTHYLRSLNESQQPWAKEKRPSLVWKKTEEGLALYNSLLDLSSVKIEEALNLYKFQYYLTTIALNSSFIETYQIALKNLNNKLAAFQLTFRLKRGLSDTSQPGAFTKNIVYYEGYQEIKNYLKAGGRYEDLYWGKIAWSEIETLRPQANTKKLFLPLFRPNSSV